LRSIQVAGRFAARSDWQADLGDFEREVDRDLRTIAFEDQGGAGADDEAKRPIGEQGRQASRYKASGVNFPSMTRRYRKKYGDFRTKTQEHLDFQWRARRDSNAGPSA
jgi:hypothetical protein